VHLAKLKNVQQHFDTGFSLCLPVSSMNLTGFEIVHGLCMSRDLLLVVISRISTANLLFNDWGAPWKQCHVCFSVAKVLAVTRPRTADTAKTPCKYERRPLWAYGDISLRLKRGQERPSHILAHERRHADSCKGSKQSRSGRSPLQLTSDTLPRGHREHALEKDSTALEVSSPWKIFARGRIFISFSKGF